MKRFAIYWAVFVCIWGLIYYAAMSGSEGAGRTLFAYSIIVLLSGLGSRTDDGRAKMKEKAIKDTRYCQFISSFDYSFSVMECLAFCWLGWWWIAGFVFVGCNLYHLSLSQILDEIKETA